MLNLHSNWRNVSIAFLATVSVSVCAQEARQGRGPWVWDVAAGAVSQLSADLSDGSGDVSITRGFVGGGPGYAWDRDTSISVSLGVSSADYDFSSDALIEGRKAARWRGGMRARTVATTTTAMCVPRNANSLVRRNG